MIDYLSVALSVGANQTTYKQCQAINFIGVNDGARTRDNRNHNPGLYQLSYAHHNMGFSTNGALGRTRTCDPRLRRPVLYPVELQALNWSG